MGAKISRGAGPTVDLGEDRPDVRAVNEHGVPLVQIGDGTVDAAHELAAEHSTADGEYADTRDATEDGESASAGTSSSRSSARRRTATGGASKS